VWTTNPDGSDPRSNERAGARPHDDEDLLQTVTLTDRRHLNPDSPFNAGLRVNPDLAATAAVERPEANPDLAATLLVRRPPAARADETRVLVGAGLLTAPAPVSSPVYTTPRPTDPRLDQPAYADPRSPSYVDYARPAGPGNPGGPQGGPKDGRHPEPAPRRRGSTRRVLLAAGGLTLLGGLGVAAGHSFGSAAHPSAAAPPAGQPGGPASPGTEPAGAFSAPARATTRLTPAPPTTPATPANSPFPVQTAPEYYVHNGAKGIALTLDDGPTAEYTPKILALLQQYGIIATFCMIGNQIPPNAALVREVAAAGHAIVNHTWDHADQTKLTPTQVRDSMARTSEALNDVGVTPAIYRAPYGSWNANVFQACADARLRPLDWSVDPQDWARPGSSVIVQRILQQTSTGSIILEHDGGGDRSQTVDALTVVLPELLNAGYRFGPV
jgi:peptidoglycan-N-acetylglucosamine deacetylase